METRLSHSNINPVFKGSQVDAVPVRPNFKTFEEVRHETQVQLSTNVSWAAMRKDLCGFFHYIHDNMHNVKHQMLDRIEDKYESCHG